VLDLGGNKIRKRGQFDIERYDLRVVYANLSTAKRPDVQADAACVPFGDGCFDAVICSELLEHVPDPREVLGEAYRVLRPNGKLLVCAPFLFPVHADPYDYGRFTDYYWQESLSRIGFTDIHIERQGLFWSVLVDFLKQYAAQVLIHRRIRWMAMRAIALAQRWVFRTEAQPSVREHPFLHRFTTGFGIVCTK
jgi:ubiquinone/menaquinone biosynthesis C-methylase UbiE